MSIAKAQTTIGAICDKFDGEVQTGPFGSQLHASDYSDEGTPVIMPQDMVDGRISCDRAARVGPMHVSQLHRHKLRVGDVLFSRRGDVTRFAVVTEREAGWLCGTGSIRIRLNCPDVDVGYLRRYLQLPAVGAWLIHNAQGVTMANLNTSILRGMPLYYPPLPEQRRIAAILDQADALRVKRRAALEKLDETAKSIFLDLVGDPRTNPRQFSVGTIEDVVADPRRDVRCGPFGTQLKVGEIVSEGVPLLGIENVLDDRFVPSISKFLTSRKADELRAFDVSAGDVLVTRMGTIGRACVVPPEFEGGRFSYHLFRIRADRRRCLPEFLAATISKSGTFEAQLRAQAHGAIMDGLSTSNLRAVKFTFPPLSVQLEFSERLSGINRLRSRQTVALAKLDALFASLQHRAFRGEL